jgi:homopolymeric O-antigen transport system ATP-binding protein
LSGYAIQVEGLSKQYVIGAREAGYKTFREALVSGFAAPFRRFAKLSGHVSAEERIWALNDVSFEVKPGEVVGIIGRNGAGKSTLLKILSRITEPTKGRIKLRGRIASLLEVGTGFHPELTGRENIFLNGAILGMTKADIRKKFGEIAAFAEIEKFLDTPVKRYSSGMYVRLAFAVAAHLEPDILVVDEVLAVGDTEFQKKCIGKMQSVGRTGRTVLFVSHNMAAVKSLTTRGILLDGGNVDLIGTSEQVIERYMQLTSCPAALQSYPGWGHGTHTAIREARLLDKNGKPTTQYIPGECFRLEVVLETDGARGMSLELFLTDATRTRLGLASLCQFHGQTLPEKAGTYRVTINLHPMWLASGKYTFDVTTSVVNCDWDHSVESAVEFEVQFSNPLGYPWDFKQSYGYGPLALLSQPVPEFQQI